jgi:hypothetical protein
MKFTFLLDQKDSFGLLDSQERDIGLIVFKLSPPCMGGPLDTTSNPNLNSTTLLQTKIAK